ncbi:hypothetical protein [Mesorhizobium sp. M4B.F.Ca.ET.017.02.2.1]|uniref:hypothetical protein n=1 Tax=Mesorhizobium sp. M4B.F.Ca.ET.017.02.2.1 TaxID=2496649 RepID=UPI0016779C4F|nr:hypothetical protein [Mesorhizobium sp. M4B.F.Ca.ET.017.02.2.1]
MHKIELTDEQMNIIGSALADLPYKVAAPVINAIQIQLTAEDKAPAPAGKKPRGRT